MWPDGIRTASVSLAFAGINNIHKVHLAVVVVVIQREVRAVLIRQLTRLFDHRSYVRITTVAAVLAIHLVVALHRVRTDYIKHRLVLTVTLVNKILTRTTARVDGSLIMPAVVIVTVIEMTGEIRTVHHGIHRVVRRYEGLVLKVHQDDQPARSDIEWHSSHLLLGSSSDSLLFPL